MYWTMADLYLKEQKAIERKKEEEEKEKKAYQALSAREKVGLTKKYKG